ncbi:hypothetical protein OTB23_20935, partial [Streptomyces sp. H34-AA3]|nr:hypothetical protein [Streptomyces sp. H34-AA3]
AGPGDEGDAVVVAPDGTGRLRAGGAAGGAVAGGWDGADAAGVASAAGVVSAVGARREAGAGGGGVAVWAAGDVIGG